MQVPPLNHSVAIVDSQGRPTPYFLRWVQNQLFKNAEIVDLSTAAGVSTVLDHIGSVQGDTLFRGSMQWAALPPGTAGDVLTTGGPGADPSWQTPVRAFLDLSDVPVAYTGSGGLIVAVKGTEDGLEFVTAEAELNMLFDAGAVDSGDPYIFLDFGG